MSVETQWNTKYAKSKRIITYMPHRSQTVVKLVKLYVIEQKNQLRMLENSASQLISKQ